jgi:hypothetical protein
LALINNHHPGTPKLNHNNQERQINTSQVQYKTITYDLVSALLDGDCFVLDLTGIDLSLLIAMI